MVCLYPIRAVYRDADIYLLDDPLSAVDTKVARHIFYSCISQFLADKSVILVTHQLQFLSGVDKIVVLQDVSYYFHYLHEVFNSVMVCIAG